MTEKKSFGDLQLDSKACQTLRPHREFRPVELHTGSHVKKIVTHW